MQRGVHICCVQGTEKAGCLNNGDVRVRHSLEIARDSVDWTSEKQRPLVRVLTFNSGTLAEVCSMFRTHCNGRAKCYI